MSDIAPHDVLKIPVRLVRDSSSWHRTLQELQANNIWAVDTICSGPDPMTDRVLHLLISTNQACYAINVHAIRNVSSLLPLLQHPRRLKVFHHGKVTIRFLARLLNFGQPLGDLSPTIFDTYIASQLLNDSGEAHSLSSLVQQYLGLNIADTPIPRGSRPGADRGIDIQAAAQRVSSLLPLRTRLRQELIDAELVKVAKIEFDLVPVVADIEEAGIYLNRDAWDHIWQGFRKERNRLHQKLEHSLGAYMPQSLFGTAVFDPDSPQQTLEALQKLGLDIPHTGENVLKQYASTHPAVQDLLDYRSAAKAITSFGDVFPQYIQETTARIHATYNQIGARTGRMSCSNPNVQQVPRQKEIRSCFQAQDGNALIVADYSQVELRVAASLARDERMIEAYRNNQDLHRLTASLITGTPLDRVDRLEREAAKAVNFGLLFAMGAPGLARYASSQYGVNLSLKQAESFRNRFFAAYRGIGHWHERAKQHMREAQRSGEAMIRSVAGRRFFYSGQQGLAWFLNSPVQGSAADLMKNALVRVHNALSHTTRGRIIAVIHDELLVEAPKEEADAVSAIVRREMEASGADFFSNTPFVADTAIVPSWGDAP